MIISLTLSLIAIASGTLLTYTYDEDAPLASRLCSGACIGFALFGLIGFGFALFIGLTPTTLIVTAVLLATPGLLLRSPERRAQISTDINKATQAISRASSQPDRWHFIYFLFYAGVMIVMWLVFSRAIFEDPEGIYTGVLNNYGDLPFHLSVITRFAFGQNFPPEDPTFAGVRFTYPFITDFVSAMFVRAGASLRASLFIENWIVGVALVGVLHRFGLQLLRNRTAAILTPVLVILNGGFGWAMLFGDVNKGEGGVFQVLTHIKHSYTILPEGAAGWRWGNAVTSLLVPQRGFLLGIPLAVIVFTQWWASRRSSDEGIEQVKSKKVKGKKEERRDKKLKAAERANGRAKLTGPGSSLFPFTFLLLPSAKRMLAAGVVAGLLPLVHAHSFIAVMGVGAFLALINWSKWREWLLFFLVASIIAVPQLLWSTHGSAVNTRAFMGWEFGWDKGNENFFWFWFKNTGLFIPLLIAAILWRGSESNAEQLFSFKGRISRRTFLAALLSLMVLNIIGGLLISLVGTRGALGQVVTLIIYIVWLPLAGWIGLATQVRRWHDLGYSGWMVLISLVPIAGIVTLIPLVFIKGTAGPNQYGDDPLKHVAQRTEYLVSRKLLFFYLPFTLCFIVPNLIKLAPWIWDNVKVLFYWWIASAPIVALLLARLWEGNVWNRVQAVTLFLVLTLAGGLDVFALLTRQGKYEEFDRDGVNFAEMIKQQTPPRATILHAPIHNTPVFLTGRRSLMGYPGHIWTHGLDFGPRETEIRRIYSGSPDAVALLAKYGVDYVVIDPQEHSVMTVNTAFFSRYREVAKIGDYHLYKITP